MLISENGRNAIKNYEQLRLKAYKDGGGVWTCGWGSTRGVGPSTVWTLEEAQDHFDADVNDAEVVMRRFVPDEILSAIPAGAVDALGSFTFNVGSQGYLNRDGSSTGLRRALLARRFADVPIEMKRWVHDNGKVVNGLVNRRNAEALAWSRAFT